MLSVLLMNDLFLIASAASLRSQVPGQRLPPRPYFHHSAQQQLASSTIHRLERAVWIEPRRGSCKAWAALPSSVEQTGAGPRSRERPALLQGRPRDRKSTLCSLDHQCCQKAAPPAAERSPPRPPIPALRPRRGRVWLGCPRVLGTGCSSRAYVARGGGIAGTTPAPRQCPAAPAPSLRCIPPYAARTTGPPGAGGSSARYDASARHPSAPAPSLHPRLCVPVAPHPSSRRRLATLTPATGNIGGFRGRGLDGAPRCPRRGSYSACPRRLGGRGLGIPKRAPRNTPTRRAPIPRPRRALCPPRRAPSRTAAPPESLSPGGGGGGGGRH